MERSLIILAVLALLHVGQAKAEGDDFGIWTEVGTEKKINRNWSLDGEFEFRSRDNLKVADRWSLGVGATYRLTSWLKASAGYILLNDHEVKDKTTAKYTDENHYRVKQTYANYRGLRHRFHLTLSASQTFGRLTVSLRERWQYTYRPEKTVDRTESWVEYLNYADYENGTVYDHQDPEVESNTYTGKGKNVWRNRLKLEYKINKHWRPYASAETNVSHGLEKVRYAAGTEIRLSKKHLLDVKYMFQHSTNDEDEEGNRHILGIGYTFKF